jgi:ADP-L-glycero-D-manno-heptose 6-epimerase
MASVVYKFYKQYKATGTIKLFENSENYRRDFIHVDDIVDVNLSFFKSTIGGIYNVGTGVSRSFRDIADIFVKRYNCKIEEIPMPDKLIGKYQTFTESDNTKISSVINKAFMSLEQGVNKYLDFLETQ